VPIEYLLISGGTVLETISSESGSVEEMEAEEKGRNPKENEGLCFARAGQEHIIDFGLGPYLGHETSAKSSSLLIHLAKTLIKVFPQT
jgi:hypothetical protein